jgi:hypothetical protein
MDGQKIAGVLGAHEMEPVAETKPRIHPLLKGSSIQLNATDSTKDIQNQISKERYR